MSLTAIVLILIAAVAHASWNLFSKQAAAGGAVCFVWLFFTAGAVLYAPVAGIVLVVSHPRLAGLPAVFMAGTAIIHIGYALLLQNGYRLGDLSVVYPIGRGSGALLAAAAGIVLLGERPGPLSTAGILLIIAGVIVIGLPGRARTGIAPAPSPPALMGITFALLTGLTIAAYTVWDKYAVATLHIPPVLEDWAATLGVTLAVAPIALRDRARLATVWHCVPAAGARRGRSVPARLHPGADRAAVHRDQRGRAVPRGERPVRSAARQEAARRGQRGPPPGRGGRHRGGHHRGGDRLSDGPPARQAAAGRPAARPDGGNRGPGAANAVASSRQSCIVSERWCGSS